MKDGDIITIDAEKGTIELELSSAELAARKKAWKSLKRGRQKFVGYEATQADTDILAFRQDQKIFKMEVAMHKTLRACGQRFFDFIPYF